MNKYVFDGNPEGSHELLFISHAHDDHLPNKKSKVLASSITIDVANIRKNKRLLDSGEMLWSDEKYILYDAGHVPGSKMIELEINNIRILYTGDFSLHKNPLVDVSMPSHKIDILIMDGTYFSPYYSLPEPKSVIDEIIEFIHKNDHTALYFFVYPYGKSQVLGSYFDKYGLSYYYYDGFKRLNDVVEKHLDYKFSGKYLSLEEIKKKDSGVFILPLRYRHMISRGIKLGISGWGKSPYYAKMLGLDKVFPYSDHADFNDLLYFIERLKPDIIYGFQLNGNKEFFEKYLREEYGIYAQGI